MKKIAILVGVVSSLLLRTTLFAKNMDNNMGVERNGNWHIKHSMSMMGGREHKFRGCNGMGYIRNKDIEANRITIMEKKLEIRKEVIKDNPDWNKVEKLNQEIASKRASNQTIRMRERVSSPVNQQ